MFILKKWLQSGAATPAKVDEPAHSLEARFTDVYESRLWGSEESASGLGSERGSGQVTHALDLLRRMIRDYGVRSISDVPCGDFNWMPILLDEHPDIDYIGYDVVAPLIRENQRRHPTRQFDTLDITKEIPRQSDLVFSKDMLNHLSHKDVWAALSNMVASNARYVMVTNNTGFENVELDPSTPHASRYLDVFAAPFLMPPPLYSDHYMIIWERDTLVEHMQQGFGGSPA